MGDVTMVGLGLMGTALATAIQAAGHDLVVWNRSPEKTEPFQSQGAAAFDSLASSVEASPIVLICVDTYETTKSLFDTADVAALMRDRTVVQLSSARPSEAQEAADWMAAHQARYLDGAILAGPNMIGTPAAKILLSGDEVAHERSVGRLKCLGTLRYLGRNVRAASALDMAWLMSRFGNQIAAIHAARICQSEGAALDDLIPLYSDNPSLQYYIKVIAEGDFDDFTASLQIWYESLRHIQRQGSEAGINTEIPDFIAILFERALASGYAKKNVMALTRVLEQT